MSESAVQELRLAVPLPMDRIVEFCRRWGLSELSLFGSVLGSDFGPESDVDVLVDYGADWPHGLFEWVQMGDELAEIFARKADLTSKPGLSRGRNPRRRNEILQSARVIYHAA
jgi:uncharacterized protein